MKGIRNLITIIFILLVSNVLFAQDIPQGASAGVEAANLDKQIPHEKKVKKLTQDIYENIKCTKVIDAVAIEIATGEQVRLIDIEIPDKASEEATKFTKSLVEGKNVRLEFDVQQKDRYGRLLAYVFIPTILDMRPESMRAEDKGVLIPLDNTGRYEIFLNAYIVKAGYANLMTIPPNVKYADLFKNLYQEAKENKRGIWKNE